MTWHTYLRMVTYKRKQQSASLQVREKKEMIIKCVINCRTSKINFKVSYGMFTVNLFNKILNSEDYRRHELKFDHVKGIIRCSVNCKTKKSSEDLYWFLHNYAEEYNLAIDDII